MHCCSYYYCCCRLGYCFCCFCCCFSCETSIPYYSFAVATLAHLPISIDSQESILSVCLLFYKFEVFWTSSTTCVLQEGKCAMMPPNVSKLFVVSLYDNVDYICIVRILWFDIVNMFSAMYPCPSRPLATLTSVLMRPRADVHGVERKRLFALPRSQRDPLSLKLANENVGADY